MRRTALLVLALAALLVAACGGGSDGAALYRDYRSAEDARDEAEERLREAFADIAAAAGERDRLSTLAAVDRGAKAIGEIDDLLAAEIATAGELAEIDSLAREANRLEHGLKVSRRGLQLFSRELDIARLDPFLEEKANSREVTRLSRGGARRAADGELAVRRADRALALELGIEPRLDPYLGSPSTGS